MASTLSLREFDSQRPVSRHHKDENYITNAWHSMTKAFHQISENEASGDSSHPQSFLAQQRMCAALRRIRPSQDKPMVTLAGAFPHRQDSESSGNGPDEPIRGSVRVVKLSPHFLRRAAVRSKNSPSRGAFPAFLALGRAGPSAHHKPALLLPQVSASTGADARRKQGLEMWQKVMHKSKEAVALRINPKDMPKQSCAAAPFTQRITEDGCETVTVHNHLCFGQCSSMFVPSSGESRAQEAHCTRCGPSKSRSVLVPLRCGTEVRERRVMVVEECKCETSSDEVKVQNTERVHL